MSGLNVVTSNRLENLVRLLADRIEDRPRSPFEEEVILVQSKGMERWISMNLARRFGIWANARYPFPNAFVNELFQTILPDVDEALRLVDALQFTEKHGEVCPANWREGEDSMKPTAEGVAEYLAKHAS